MGRSQSRALEDFEREHPGASGLGDEAAERRLARLSGPDHHDDGRVVEGGFEGRADMAVERRRTGRVMVDKFTTWW